MADAAAAEPADYDALTAHRAVLRDAIARRDAERKKLAKLEAGKAKAHASLREAESQQHDAESALNDARHREGSFLASSFINGGSTDGDPVALATAVLNSAKAEAAKFERKLLTVKSRN
jgi:hypothetical protein